MLAAIRCQEPDYPPCSFMMFNALKSRCVDYYDFIRRQIDLGLDTCVEIPVRPPRVVNDYYNLHGLPVSYDPRVTTREWVSHAPGEEHPILVKEYSTPAGILTSEVRRTPDWRWGSHVPFLDDYLTPRSRKFLIQRAEDLEPLSFLLQPPREEEVRAFHAEADLARRFTGQHHLLFSGGWGVGADLVGWVYGLESMMCAVYDAPDFLTDLLELIADWNQHRMKLILETDIDLFIKRAWYENCDFWSPKMWRRFIFPILKADVELAHQHNTHFGYMITSNCMPLLPYIAEAGVDVIIGVDPHQWDLAKAKQVLQDKVCLWGGVNGHQTVEMGTRAEVIAETCQAIQLLAPGGGFILSPVDNVREDTSNAMDNVRAMIAEWQHELFLT